MVLAVFADRRRLELCFTMALDGPLLAACRIVQALLAALALPTTPTPLTTTTTHTTTPLHLLRTHQLTGRLAPLQARLAWALSPAAVSGADGQDGGGVQCAAYWMHGVEVVQLRRLQADVARLAELGREDAGWARQQRRAVLLGVWRGRCGQSGVGGSLGVFAADRFFDVQLVREVFGYVWE